MPLYKIITVNKNTVVRIWNITEPYKTLCNNIDLTANCEARLGAMRSEMHRLGFLSIRQLLKVAGYPASALYYDTFGKPHLMDGRHISVTHSYTFSAIIISDDIKVGIDIEKQRDKIRKIADKFIGYEGHYLSERRLTEKLTLIWCMKESLYKSFGTAGLSFKQHCSVIPFDPDAQQTKAWICYKSRLEKHDIRFFSFDGFSCAYSLRL